MYKEKFYDKNGSLISTIEHGSTHYNKNEKTIYHYKNEKLHCEDGPAVIVYENDEIKEELYYINGVELDQFQSDIMRASLK